MEKLKSKLYEFHFRIDLEMERELTNLELYKNQKKFSRLIINIIKILCPRLENELLVGRQRNNRYKLVNSNTKIERKSVHVYMPCSMYRKLKLMHHDLNFYSIAQLLRWILRFFLNLNKEYGENVVNKLKKLLMQWREKSKVRRYKIKPVRQLLHFIYQKPNRSRFLTIYSNTYSPISIYRY